jgi:hypothetical protein
VVVDGLRLVWVDSGFIVSDGELMHPLSSIVITTIIMLIKQYLFMKLTSTPVFRQFADFSF